MKILAVETVTSWQSVAILQDDRVLARHDQQAGGAHGTLLLPAIDRLLMQTALRFTDLDGLACSIGPGSFTGIRVGAATCLGLRAATGLPLALVSTLEAMAWNARASALPVCPVLMSRRGEVYWAIFRWTHGGQLERVVAEHVGPPRDLAQSLTENMLVFGEGWSSMEPEIRAALSPSIVVSVGPEGIAKPSAVNVALVGMQRLQRGEIAGDQIAPLYVQRAEAELQYEQSGGILPIARRQERVAKKVAERWARGRRGAGGTVRAKNSRGS
ncbi:MAG: tRNA (adenosine(37)-N6)-threonylcarbamoyltransferase complex dimerization subunit type 1 TsaB [Nitrospirae bacterium]|nr:tRNA (adenosine(37)-N6)-threonylcarbamoyltransferase complex dimerization subunit type 1 TsaB [Nitrospirota bacterium]